MQDKHQAWAQVPVRVQDISAALLQALTRAVAAFAEADRVGADSAIAEAADLCRQLQRTGEVLPERDLAEVERLFRLCGASLGDLNRQLEMDSRDGENVRRGIASYRQQSGES